MSQLLDSMPSALEVAAAIRAKEVSPLEVLDACLARVDSLNGEINAVTWRNDDDARKVAREAGEVLAGGGEGELPPFFGVPIPIKDLTLVSGWPVTYGSWGAPEGVSGESEMIVQAFQRAGFVLTARTNTPEFGPITAAENDRYGATRNPWDLERTPGGSSGGAAASVAAGMFPLAHGNDGGGSIRIPASCCGLVGLKVSRGRVPTTVLSWEGGSVEGVLTRDVSDSAAILDVICGPDPGQWYNAPVPERRFFDEVGRDPGRLRIAVVRAAPFGLPVDPECIAAVDAAAKVCESLGHDVFDMDLPATDEIVEPFFTIVNGGLAGYDDIDWSRTGSHIRANLKTAESVNTIQYVRAVHALQRWSRGFVAHWGKEFDLLITPTMTIQPPKVGEVLAAATEAAEGSGSALVVLQMAIFTSVFNITGQPAVSLPVYQSEQDVPIGVQFVGGPWGESQLIRLAAQIEQVVSWRKRRPAFLG
ncbi:MAG: amidase [Ferrimicrobium sp.]